MASHGAQQGAFPDARAAKQADPLALAASQQAVDDANAGRQPLIDRFSFHRPWRSFIELVEFAGVDRPLVIDGASEAVDNPAQKLFSHSHASLFAASYDRDPQPQTIDLRQRHRQHAPTTESDDLRADSFPCGGLNLA